MFIPQHVLPTAALYVAKHAVVFAKVAAKATVKGAKAVAKFLF